MKLENYKYSKFSPVVGLEDYALKAASEGMVLLKNDNNILPIVNKKIALFGRIQTNYYKSGTGSGGLVNVHHVPSIRETLLENPLVSLNQELIDVYDEWLIDNAFNAGNGMWASEPWCQTEMKLDPKLVKKVSKDSDVAVVVIGRTAGEDCDNFAGKGSYELTDLEEEMLEVVSKNFKHVVVLLNVGNVVDMTFVNKYKIDSVMYIWHGGTQGARAATSVLTGLISPSGKLVDTIAKSISDYPSDKNFGSKTQNIYQEDIYVGYRYFNTFAVDKILYPFGFGLSYTNFKQEIVKESVNEEIFTCSVKVTNTGKYSGKEVVQIYMNPAQGALGRPKTELVGFAKTKLLLPNESQILDIEIKLANLVTYDDCGASGFKNSFVLENGTYTFCLGTDSLNLSKINEITLKETKCYQTVTEAMTSVVPFKRMKPVLEKGKFTLSYEDTPTRSYDLNKKIEDKTPKEIPYKESSLTLEDVYDSKCSMDDFIGSLDDTMLACICRGEGMSSPKVTSGTAGCFGGVTDALVNKKVPTMCCADGPSGIRMDSGQIASSLPNGTLMASSFNVDIAKELYMIVGLELKNYNIDVLLGPGMNLHRHPLNGRNFEYFSEDPLVTGMFGAAFSFGLQDAEASGTLKHLACNSQEAHRVDVDAVLSERALRDIYLKGFEIAIKSADSHAIMTSYNPINGIWAASNFELNYQIVREEWGFKGIIMTDWWAKMNDDGGVGTKENSKAMIRATNDLYMVTSDALNNSANDNTIESLKDGSLKRAWAQTCAKNICEFALTTKTFKANTGKRIDTKDYNFNKWFKSTNSTYEFDELNTVKINGEVFKDFLPHVTVYTLTTPIETIEVSNGEVVKGNGHAIVTMHDNIYYFNYRDKVIKNKVIDIDNATFDNKVVLGCNAWDTSVLDLTKYSCKTNTINLKDGEFVNCDKGEYVTYPIEVTGDGKYLLKYVISCNAPLLAQVAFTIFLNEENTQTITVGATNGEYIGVNASLILTKGNYQVTTRFNNAGITIKAIEFVRHG